MGITARHSDLGFGVSLTKKRSHSVYRDRATRAVLQPMHVQPGSFRE